MRFICGWRNNIFAVKNTEDFSVLLLTKELLDIEDKKEHIIGYLDGEVSVKDFDADLATHLVVDSDEEFRIYFSLIYYFGYKGAMNGHRTRFLTKRDSLAKYIKDEFNDYSKMSSSYNDLLDRILKYSTHISILDLSNLDLDKYGTLLW